MRKTSYVLTFLAVAVVLVLNVLSARRPDWLVATHGDDSVVHHGLMQRCLDGCENENRFACAEWVSAHYFTELGIGFAFMALAALLIGVSTHSRRRRVWRAVAGLLLLHAIFQSITFSLVTNVYTKNAFDAFEHAKPGLGYVLNAISCVAGFLVSAAVIITGVAADRGYKWAAGNRAYHRIRE